MKNTKLACLGLLCFAAQLAGCGKVPAPTNGIQVSSVSYYLMDDKQMNAAKGSGNIFYRLIAANRLSNTSTDVQISFTKYDFEWKDSARLWYEEAGQFIRDEKQITVLGSFTFGTLRSSN
jgi:hypothetical protein